MKVERLIFKKINMAKIMSMTANAEKDFIEKMGQHFEERWQEVISNKIQLDGNPSEEAISFAKSVFLYGCIVGWNDCYLFHEDLIQKGLNQQ